MGIIPYSLQENDVDVVKDKGDEIRRRFPRIVMNLVMAVIFWVISAYVPHTVRNIAIPGLDLNADLLTFIVSMVIVAIFLVRALSDALVLGDILTDVVVRRLGIKEERSPKRAMRDFIYIIVVILLVTAVSPILATFRADLLNIAVTYIALGLIILFFYDIGRILYRVVEEKAELLADRLAQMTEKNSKSE